MILSMLYDINYIIMLAVMLLIIAAISFYFSQKIEEQNEKISTISTVVRAMAEEIGILSNAVHRNSYANPDSGRESGHSDSHIIHLTHNTMHSQYGGDNSEQSNGDNIYTIDLANMEEIKIPSHLQKQPHDMSFDLIPVSDNDDSEEEETSSESDQDEDESDDESENRDGDCDEESVDEEHENYVKSVSNSIHILKINDSESELDLNLDECFDNVADSDEDLDLDLGAETLDALDALDELDTNPNNVEDCLEVKHEETTNIKSIVMSSSSSIENALENEVEKVVETASTTVSKTSRSVYDIMMTPVNADTHANVINFSDLKSINISMEEETEKAYVQDYKRMPLNKLRSIVVEKNLCSDASKMKKQDLFKLLNIDAH